MKYRDANEAVANVTQQNFDDMVENPAFLQWFNGVACKLSKAERQLTKEDVRNRDFQAGLTRGLQDALGALQDVRRNGLNLPDSEVGGRHKAALYAAEQMKDFIYGDA